MTPKGLLAYVAGLVALLLASSLTGLVIFFAFVLPFQPSHAGPLLLLCCVTLAFAALHLLAAGVYRMLVHLYHLISRVEPRGDRRLRGRTLFLLGQIATTMTVPTTALFCIAAARGLGAHRPNDDLALLGILPTGFALLLSVVAMLTGLGIMLRDLCLRQQEIGDAREAARRRRLAEEGEPRTEVIPEADSLSDELRERVK